MNLDPHPIPTTWLAAYYDGELDEERRAQVEAHLAACAECQDELAALEGLSRSLTEDRLPAMREPAAFWSEVEGRLPERSPASFPFHWLPGLGLLLVHGLVQFAAAASLVLLLAGQAGRLPIPLDWVDEAVLGWLLGWAAWLAPREWSAAGSVLMFFVVSAGLAILYVAWLTYVWRYRRVAVHQ